MPLIPLLRLYLSSSYIFSVHFVLVSQYLLWYLELELLKLIFSSYLLTFQLTDGLMSTTIKLECLKTLLPFFSPFYHLHKSLIIKGQNSDI